MPEILIRGREMEPMNSHVDGGPCDSHECPSWGTKSCTLSLNSPIQPLAWCCILHLLVEHQVWGGLPAQAPLDDLQTPKPNMPSSDRIISSLNLFSPVFPTEWASPGTDTSSLLSHTH